MLYVIVGKENETPFHFFFECEKYIFIRNDFMNKCANIQNVNMHTLLNGSRGLSQHDNICLHNAVSDFIISSHRF